VSSLVSVIVPTYNGEAFVREALESILAQEHPAVEILVCDDGSTDGTVEVVKAFGAALRLLQQPNRGVSAARNRCAVEARGRFLAFLDQDDRYEPGMLASQVQALERHAEWAFVYADSWVIDATGRIRGRRSQHLDCARGDVFVPLLSGNFVPIETLVMPRELFQSLGGFREDLRYLEDFELCLRAARRAPVGFDERCLARYRIHETNLSHAAEEIVREYHRILEELSRAGGLTLEEERRVGLELARRRGELAWHAFRRGDRARAEGLLRGALAKPELRLKLALARTLFALFPAARAAWLLSALPRPSLYGVRSRRRRRLSHPRERRSRGDPARRAARW
jgi:GT2 family glycosyltransferase